MSDEKYTDYAPIDPHDPAQKAEQLVGYLDGLSASLREGKAVSFAFIVTKADGSIETGWFDPGAVCGEGQRLLMVAGTVMLQGRLASYKA